jgi:hypothetical protein
VLTIETPQETKPQPTRCAWCGDVGHLRGQCVERIIHEAEEAL